MTRHNRHTRQNEVFKLARHYGMAFEFGTATGNIAGYEASFMDSFLFITLKINLDFENEKDRYKVQQALGLSYLADEYDILTAELKTGHVEISFVNKSFIHKKIKAFMDYLLDLLKENNAIATTTIIDRGEDIDESSLPKAFFH